MSSMEAILQQAAALSPDEQRELGLRLLEGDLGPDDAHATEAWGREVARRLAAFDRGEVKAVSAEAVFAGPDRAIAKARG